MRYCFLLFIFAAISATTNSRDRADNAPAEPSNNDIRKALIKSALERDRGDITVMESLSRDGKGVLIGFTSGALLHCYGTESCREFEGAPDEPIRQISVSQRGATEVVWVAYPHGIIYQCADYYCQKFTWYIAQDN